MLFLSRRAQSLAVVQALLRLLSRPVFQRVFPYISAMVNNGSLSYDHERDGRLTEIGGCTAIVRNLRYDTFLVIRYVKRHLTVSPVPEPLVIDSASALMTYP